MTHRRVARLAGPAYLTQQVSVVALGTVVSQAILFASSVPLARMYRPDEFGEFSVTLSVSSILVILATMRLEAAIPLAGTDEEAKQITAAAIFCVMLTTTGLTVLLSLSLTTGRGRLPVAHGGAMWLVPPMVLSLGLWTAIRMFRSRQTDFARISRSTLSSACAQSVIQIVAGVFHAGAVGLSLGYLAGRLWQVGSLHRGSGLICLRPISRFITPIRGLSRFAAMNVVPSLLNAVCVGAVAPYVALLYGVPFAGLFAFATRVLALPSVLLGQAVGTVFFPVAAEMDRAGTDLSGVIRNATTALMMLGVAPFGLALLLGPEMVAVAFGTEWRGAGQIAVLLAPWLAASLISSPLSGMATVKRRFGRLFALSIVETFARMGSLSAGLLAHHPMVGVAAYSASGFVISVYYIAWSMRLAGGSIGAWVSDQRRYLSTVLLGYPVLLLTRDHVSLPIYATVALAVTAVMVGWAAWSLRRMRGEGSSADSSDVPQPVHR